MSENPFEELGIGGTPVILAPLAGVSDHPFRRACQAQGADLSYVEMISATALSYRSKKTLEMLVRHPDEPLLGVQVTARSPEEMAVAAEILDRYSFETLDINMGCPVKKVVKSGCGSAILKDPERVYQTTLAAVRGFSKPVSVKIRLGWDRSSINWQEVSSAACSAGARWITVHGRTRSEGYADPVSLDAVASLKAIAPVPVIGNGNIFSYEDARLFRDKTGVDGWMISRGALGNPWIFREIKTLKNEVTVEQWYFAVKQHLSWQKEAYGDHGAGAVCMRKHVLWYLSGWPSARAYREKIGKAKSLMEVVEIIDNFYQSLRASGHRRRFENLLSDQRKKRFVWDPKFEMDRHLDCGVGGDGLDF